MTTYTYSGIEIVDGQVFQLIRCDRGDGPPEIIRVPMGNCAMAWNTLSEARRTVDNAWADGVRNANTYTLVDALQTPSPARDEAMRQADARKGTE